MCSSLGTTIAPATRIPWFPIFLCVGLRPHEFLPVLLGMSIGIALVKFIFRQLCWLDFMGISPGITRRHRLTAKSPNSLNLTIFPFPFPQYFPSSGCGSCMRPHIHWDWTPKLCVFIVLLYNGVHLLQREISEEGGLQLPVGIGENIWNVFRDNAGLLK